MRYQHLIHECMPDNSPKAQFRSALTWAQEKLESIESEPFTFQVSSVLPTKDGQQKTWVILETIEKKGE